MRINKILLLFFFQLLLLTTTNFASGTYFNFSLPSIFLKQGKEYSVVFSYFLNGVYERNFVVIPNVEGSLLEIYNEASDSWVKQNELRSAFPKLKPTMLLRIANLTGISTKICFDIQLLKTAEVYKTPCKIYWNRNYFLKYIDAVNVKIFKWAKGKN